MHAPRQEAHPVIQQLHPHFEEALKEGGHVVVQSRAAAIRPRKARRFQSSNSFGHVFFFFLGHSFVVLLDAVLQTHDPIPIRLVVGLGNPGRRYQNTPHNLGFMVVDRLAERHGIRIGRKECLALVGAGEVEGSRCCWPSRRRT